MKDKFKPAFNVYTYVQDLTKKAKFRRIHSFKNFPFYPLDLLPVVLKNFLWKVPFYVKVSFTRSDIYLFQTNITVFRVDDIGSYFYIIKRFYLIFSLTCRLNLELWNNCDVSFVKFRMVKIKQSKGFWVMFNHSNTISLPN